MPQAQLDAAPTAIESLPFSHKTGQNQDIPRVLAYRQPVIYHVDLVSDRQCPDDYRHPNRQGHAEYMPQRCGLPHPAGLDAVGFVLWYSKHQYLACGADTDCNVPRFLVATFLLPGRASISPPRYIGLSQREKERNQAEWLVHTHPLSVEAA